MGFSFGYFADEGRDATENYASLDIFFECEGCNGTYLVEIQRRDMDRGD